MTRTLGFFAALLAATCGMGLLAGCGSRTLDTPETLRIDEYPAGVPFTLTFVMKGCSDRCSTYEAAECSVDFADEGTVIQISVSVPYSDKADVDREALEDCTLQCGAPVLAHCSIPALGPGTWSVEAGTFRSSIEVR